MVNEKKSDDKSRPAWESVGSDPMKAGRRRKEEVGRSGVPFTRPDAPRDTQVRPAGSFGQGERGARGYESHGGSELTYEGGQVFGGPEKDGSLAAHSGGDIVEIPAEQWIGFFDSFSRQHEGWLASIEITEGNAKRTELRDRPLEGISCDQIGARDEIYLSFDGGEGVNLTHPVRNPMKVVFRRDIEGAHEGIDLNSADGSLTSVRFRIPAKPETLDGLLTEANLAPACGNSLAGRRKSNAQSASDPSVMAFHLPAEGVLLDGELTIPTSAKGVVLFAHGSGSSRHSPRNQYVARVLQQASFATLLMDLLTMEEERRDRRTAGLRFDIELLARRLTAVTWWIKDQSATANLHIGYFGASTGAAAALVAAARLTGKVSAIVSRGGRPDLAGMALHKVIAPTLLIVGENDPEVLAHNREAYYAIPSEKKMEIVPRATHLFEERGALERVAQLARDWFDAHLASPGRKSEAA